MQARKRHTLLWKGIRPLASAAAWLLFGFDTDICREKGPMIVLPNHNADLDPLFLACAFPEPLYFVASEHILRSKAGAFLHWATEIIPRQKGGSASSTVRSILRHTHDGHDVCLFPEGNRSWDGVTRPITPATGKMVRLSGAKLVTYRLEGTYFSNPRWAGGSIRRGKVHGSIVGVYEPEYLRSISAKAVQELIERDLFENAYDRQRKKTVKFKGRHLAEHLETFLFICPHCRAEGRMRSEGDYLYCDECGTALRYTAEGFFAGEGMIFDTVLDWGIWQKEIIAKKLENSGDEPVFSDDCLKLYAVNTAESEKLLAEGKMTLYRDRLLLPDGSEIGTHEFSGMAVMGPQDLYFSTKSHNYLITSDKIRCTSKYLTACKIIDSRLIFGV